VRRYWGTAGRPRASRRAMRSTALWSPGDRAGRCGSGGYVSGERMIKAASVTPQDRHRRHRSWNQAPVPRRHDRWPQPGHDRRIPVLAGQCLASRRGRWRCRGRICSYRKPDGSARCRTATCSAGQLRPARGLAAETARHGPLNHARSASAARPTSVAPSGASHSARSPRPTAATGPRRRRCRPACS
jgi:hypothetical protein